MLSCRRKTEMLQYPLFSAETIKKDIAWNDIYNVIIRLYSHLFSNKTNNLFNRNTSTFLEEEVIGLCTLPLYINNYENIVRLDTDDIFNKDIILENKVFKITDAFDDQYEILLKDIVISNDYVLPNPGYRIITSIDIQDRFIVSLIRNQMNPNTEEELIRLCGELAEVVLQHYLIKLGVKVTYDSPDFNTSADNHTSYYKATGMICLKDYPSLRDILFEARYYTVLLYAIHEGVTLALDTYPKSYEMVIENYFNIDYRDMNKWSLSIEDLKEFEKYDLDVECYNRDQYVKYAIDRITNTFFNHVEGE